MENEVKQRNQRNRRRERAQRMQAQRESKVKDGDSGEDESPAREKPPRPPARRKKSREPLGEEDIIDGFAIMAFRTYEDLEVAVKCASSPRTNALSTKPRLPLAALAGDATRNHATSNVNSHGITLLQDAGTSDDSGRASERLTGSSVAPRDPDSSRDRLSDASSRCSSGKGYICDSEGDDDKASKFLNTAFINQNVKLNKDTKVVYDLIELKVEWHNNAGKWISEEEISLGVTVVVSIN
ncbi:unnamed protein product, partial [Brenthis ino]